MRTQMDTVSESSGLYKKFNDLWKDILSSISNIMIYAKKTINIIKRKPSPKNKRSPGENVDQYVLDDRVKIENESKNASNEIKIHNQNIDTDEEHAEFKTESKEKDKKRISPKNIERIISSSHKSERNNENAQNIEIRNTNINNKQFFYIHKRFSDINTSHKSDSNNVIGPYRSQIIDQKENIDDDLVSHKKVTTTKSKAPVTEKPYQFFRVM